MCHLYWKSQTYYFPETKPRRVYKSLYSNSRPASDLGGVQLSRKTWQNKRALQLLPRAPSLKTLSSVRSSVGVPLCFRHNIFAVVARSTMRQCVDFLPSGPIPPKVLSERTKVWQENDPRSHPFSHYQLNGYAASAL